MSSAPAVLSTRRLSVGHSTRERLFSDLDLQLDAGRLVCLLGRNGCGKTTLLRTLGGLLSPIEGEVRIDGRPLASLSPRQRARYLALLLTEREAPPLLRVREVVGLGRFPHQGWWRRDPVDQRRVEQALADTGLTALACRPVDELSDGERQKVAIGRALAQDPAVLLLDEPTAFLDLAHRAELLSLLRTVARERQRAVLLSTHDLDLALSAADEVWLADSGAIVRGAPEDLGLTGQLEGAFTAPGIRFDRLRGAFGPRIAERGVVVLDDTLGDEEVRRWTARALTRIGVSVVREAAVSVVVEGNVRAPRWRLGGWEQPFPSLAGLTAALDATLANAPRPPAGDRSGAPL